MIEKSVVTELLIRAKLRNANISVGAYDAVDDPVGTGCLCVNAESSKIPLMPYQSGTEKNTSHFKDENNSSYNGCNNRCNSDDGFHSRFLLLEMKVGTSILTVGTGFQFPEISGYNDRTTSNSGHPLRQTADIFVPVHWHRSYMGGMIARNTTPSGNKGSRLLAVVESRPPLILGEPTTKLTGGIYA